MRQRDTARVPANTHRFSPLQNFHGASKDFHRFDRQDPQGICEPTEGDMQHATESPDGRHSVGRSGSHRFMRASRTPAYRR